MAPATTRTAGARTSDTAESPLGGGSRPLHEQIATDLRHSIDAGVYPPGSSLPSESQLCARWGVSRGPVRHAIAALVTQGYVRTSRGKAPVVRARPVPQSADSYTPFSQWARAGGHDFGQRTIRFGMEPCDAETAELLGIGAGDRVYDMLRLRTLDGRACMIERSLFTEPAGTLLMKYDLDSGGISDYLAEHGVHYSMIEQQIDAVAADEVDAELLEVPVGAPLLRVRRIAAGDDGVVWEHSDDRYRPDVVTLQTSFRRAVR